MFQVARRSRLSRALGLGPAVAIVLAWAFLWAWVLAGVVAPLSRLPALEGAPAAMDRRA
jgi:hypothetical protein